MVLLRWQAERDNKSVYFQHVPAADSLAAIQPRRLVTATAYTLPAPAALVNEALMESFAEVPPEKVCVGLEQSLALRARQLLRRSTEDLSPGSGFLTVVFLAACSVV